LRDSASPASRIWFPTGTAELTKAPFDLLPYEAPLQFHALTFQSRARRPKGEFHNLSEETF
jgi:hypothetical protein